MKKVFVLLASALLFAGFSQFASAGDLGALRPCKNCHDISDKKTKIVGPPLFGVFGKAPTIEGVPFATWDEANLDKWLTNPQGVKPTAKMTFKVPNAKKRAEAIEALKTLM